MSIFMEFDNFSWYVLIFSCFYYLMYKNIIEICISIRAFLHFAINVRSMNVMLISYKASLVSMCILVVLGFDRLIII